VLVQLETYSIGTRVRVARGRLAGLTGVVMKLTDDDRNCVLAIDGWQDAAYLAVNGDLLTLDVDEESGVLI
jgi:hypothetical protein